MPVLEFKGKQHIYAHHLTVPYRPLLPDPARSCRPAGTDDNLIIHGDNLHALKALLPRYAGRVKCIYIDPPYNTGNEGWVYNDNVNSPLLKEWLRAHGPVDNEDLERHDKWLCMMWPRLHLLRELLADDGVIFVSIDDHEQHHLRMLMDEIFGKHNFIANIIWNHRKSSQNDIDISLAHNHILCFCLNRELSCLRAEGIDESKFSNPDDDPRGPWVADPMDAPNVRENLTYEILNPKTGKVYLPPAGRHWRFSKEKYDAAVKEDRIIFGKKGRSKPQYKRFLSEARERGTNISTLWNDVGTATSGTRQLITLFGENPFSTSVKPSDLIERVVKVSTNEDSVVLDSFAGSGTTAHAVLALNREDGGNRRFILVECEDYADSITAERVRRVIDGVPGARDPALREGLGGSFTYCGLGDPIELDGMLSGETLPPYAALAAYLLHTASGVSAGAGDLAPQDGDGLFHSSDKLNYHLLYRPDLAFLRSNDAILNEERAKRISAAARARNRKAVVFAAAKYIGQRELSAWGITFCQLPYELSSRVE